MLSQDGKYFAFWQYYNHPVEENGITITSTFYGVTEILLLGTHLLIAYTLVMREKVFVRLL